GTRNTPLL
ncbi:putative phosphoenolpyruvate-phosphotransferase domain protein, partial [Chlamydia psittaci 06-1683]